MVESLRRKRLSDRPDFDAAANRSICNAEVVVKTGAVDRPAQRRILSSSKISFAR